MAQLLTPLRTPNAWRLGFLPDTQIFPVNLAHSYIPSPSLIPTYGYLLAVQLMPYSHYFYITGSQSLILPLHLFQPFLTPFHDFYDFTNAPAFTSCSHFL